MNLFFFGFLDYATSSKTYQLTRVIYLLSTMIYSIFSSESSKISSKFPRLKPVSFWQKIYSGQLLDTRLYKLIQMILTLLIQIIYREKDIRRFDLIYEYNIVKFRS